EARWDIWSVARQCGSDPGDTEKLAQLMETRLALPDTPELVRLLGAGCGALNMVWSLVWHNLGATGDQRRLVEVEIPIEQVFYNRQRCGIGVNRDALDNLIEEAHTEKYDAYRCLASILGFGPDGLNYWNVRDVLDNTDAKDSIPYPDGSLYEYLRMIRVRSRFADTFVRFMRAKHSFSILRDLLPWIRTEVIRISGSGGGRRWAGAGIQKRRSSQR